MERKEFKLRFSAPSFLRRPKTENGADKSLPTSEAQRSPQICGETANPPPEMIRQPTISVAPPPSPAISHRTTAEINVPPASPRITLRITNAFGTPKPIAPTDSNDSSHPAIASPSLRRPTLGGRISLTPRRSPEKSGLLSLSLSATRSFTSSSENGQDKESPLPNKSTASSSEDVRREKDTCLSHSMASSLRHLSTTKRSPHRTHFSFHFSSTPRVSSFKKPVSVPLGSCHSHGHQPSNSGPADGVQDPNAAFCHGESTMNSTLEMLQSNDSKESMFGESTELSSPFACIDDKNEIMAKNAEIGELRTKLANFENQNTKLVSESSAMKVEVETASKRSEQLEEECKGLSKRLLETESTVKTLEQDKARILGELENNKEEKSKAEARIDELCSEVASLQSQLFERENWMSTELENKEAEIEDLNRLLDDAEAKISFLDGQLISFENEAGSLKSQLYEMTMKHSEAKENLEALLDTVTCLKEERAALETDLRNARNELRVSGEEHQRRIDEEKMSHSSTRASLEEAQMRISVLTVDLEKANKSFQQLEQTAAMMADEKLNLETRNHTLQTELRLCEESLDCAFGKVSIMETDRNNLQSLLTENQAKLELTLMELDQSKAEVRRLQLENESLSSKIDEAGGNQREEVNEGLNVFKSDEPQGDVLVVDVVPATESTDLGAKQVSSEIASVNSGCKTHYVSCPSPDMFDSNVCYSCYSVNVVLETLKSTVDIEALNAIKKCSVIKEVLRAVAQSAKYPEAHDSLYEGLRNYNSMLFEDEFEAPEGSGDEAEINDNSSRPANRKNASECKIKEELCQRQVDDLSCFVNDFVKKTIENYREAMSILHELSNDIRSLTQIYESTHSTVESLEREARAYKNSVLQMLNSSSIHQQELENKLASLKECNAKSEQERNLLRGELDAAKTAELTTKNLYSESDKLASIYSERIIDLETQICTLEQKLNAASDNESKLETQKNSLETELLAVRSEQHLQEIDAIQLRKALSDIKQYKCQLENEQNQHKATLTSLAEYREKLLNEEQKYNTNFNELRKKQAQCDHQENQIRSLKRSIDVANQNIVVKEEKIKTLESILKTKETELTSMVHRLNLAVTDLYKLREMETKLKVENVQLKRDSDNLKAQYAEAEKRFQAQRNVWNCLNATTTQDKAAANTEPQIKQEQIQSTTESAVGSTQAEPIKNQPAPATPNPLRKKFKMFNPELNVKLEPTFEKNGEQKSTTDISSEPRGKVHNQKGENHPEVEKEPSIVKGNRIAMNLNKQPRVENEDDEFQPTPTVVPARRTYTRSAKGTSAANTPKNKTNKSAPVTPQSSSNPSGPRKRSKTAQ